MQSMGNLSNVSNDPLACALSPRHQVSLNCLLIDCLTSAGRWPDALDHCRALRRAGGGAAAALLIARPLAARAAAAAVRAGGSSAAEELGRLQAEIVLPEFKVRRVLAAPLACLGHAVVLPAGGHLRRG